MDAQTLLIIYAEAGLTLDEAVAFAKLSRRGQQIVDAQQEGN